MSIPHSSGGRDYKEVPDDADAVLYFAEGLQRASEIARSILSRSDELEAYRTEAWNERMLRQQQEREEELAKIAADPELGIARAAAMINEIAENTTLFVQAIERGHGKVGRFYATRRGKTTFYYAGKYDVNGRRISRTDAVHRLAEMSERSTVQQAS